MRLNLDKLDENMVKKSTFKSSIKESFKGSENHMLRQASRQAASSAEQDRDFSRGKKTAELYANPLLYGGLAAAAGLAATSKTKEYESLLNKSDTADITKSTSSVHDATEKLNSTPHAMFEADAHLIEEHKHMVSSLGTTEVSTFKTATSAGPGTPTAAYNMQKNIIAQMSQQADLSGYEAVRKEISSVANGVRFSPDLINHTPHGTPIVTMNNDPLSMGPNVAKIDFNGGVNALGGFHTKNFIETPLSSQITLQEQVFVPTPGAISYMPNALPDNLALARSEFTTHALYSRGWEAVPAQDVSSGRIVGTMYTRRMGTATNAKAIAHNTQALETYFEAAGINPNRFNRNLSPVQKRMLNMHSTSKSITTARHLQKMSLKQFRRSVSNIFLKDIRNTDAGRAYGMMQSVSMPIQIVGRPLWNIAGGKIAYKANTAVLRHEKLLLKAKELKVGTIKNLKTMSPDAYRRILQKINADIAKQNVNGVIASRIYQNLMGFVNRGVQNITQSVIANTSSQAIASAAAQIGRGTSFLANANSLGAAKAQISAVARQQAKNAAKQAAKGLQREAYKGVNKVFGKRVAKQLAQFVQRRLAWARGLSNTLKTIKRTIMAAIRSILSLVGGALSHIIIVVIIISAILFLINAIGTQIINYTGFTSVADSSTDESADANNERLDISEPINILHDLHKDYKETIKQAIKDNDAVADPVYDNGSKENYKECISALTVMTFYDYGEAGKTITEKALKQVYNKTHSYEVVATEFERTVTDPKTKEETKEYYTKNVIHVKIVRDQAVVNKDLYDQVTSVSAGSGNIPSPEEISNNNWLECVKNTKQIFASQIGNYTYGGKATLKYKGKSISVRSDCSGYVSACLYFYGLTGNNTMAYSSLALKDGIPNFTKYLWDGSSDKLQAGDILVYSGHTEIYGGNLTVYNYGGDTSAKNPGAYSKTSYKDHPPVCILRMNKNLLTRNEDESLNAEENTKKDNNKKEDNLSKDNKNSPAASIAPSLNVQYHDAVVPNLKEYTGFKSYMSYKATTAGRQKQMHSKYTIDNDGFCRVGDRYVIAIGSGAIGGSSNKAWQSIVGQYVDLILANGTVIECVVGDAKDDRHTDDATHFMTKYSHCVSEFLVDGKPRNGAANAARAGTVSVYKSSWTPKVSVIRVYDKNVLGGSGYTGTSTVGSGDGSDIEVVEYDKNGNEVGGTDALVTTLIQYNTKNNDGSFSPTYKVKSKHNIKSTGGKITSVDYLRYIYAQHGVTLPLTAQYTDSMLKKVESKDKQKGDILLYKMDENGAISDKNVVAFAYLGNKQISGFVPAGFMDANGTEYPDDKIITIKTDDLKKKNMVGWYEVTGIRKEKAYGASPSVGFGGWTDDTEVLFTGVYGNDDMWKENANDELYAESYKGYYEDDFGQDSIASPSKKDRQAFLDEIRPAAEYAYTKYGILPSLFASIACESSNYGSTVLSSKYHNPLGLRYYKGCGYEIADSENISKVGIGMEQAYISCPSYKACVDAWVDQIKSTHSFSFYNTLTGISGRDPSTLSYNVNGLYEVEIRYYYSSYSTDRIEKMIEIVEKNKLYNWDAQYTGESFGWLF